MKTQRVEFTGKILDVGGVETLATRVTDEYGKRVRGVIKRLADVGKFTAEDVREIAGDPLIPNALGGLMRAAVKAGVIKRVGYDNAYREKSRARVIAVYAKNENGRGIPAVNSSPH